MAERHYGWRRQNPDHRDIVLSIHPSSLVALPSSQDLRPHMPPVYDQGRLGSCTGNGIAGALQYDAIVQGLSIADTVPSRLFIYYNERVAEGTVNSDAGAAIRDGVKSVVSQGFCGEDVWPYDITKFTEQPPAEAYAAATKEMVKTYAAVQQDQNQMKAVLAAGFPIIFGFTVYESFESQVVSTTGRMPMPRRGERVLGGHCVLMVGYDDAKQVWLCRNSWDVGWGEKGYFWMPYAFAVNQQYAADFWVINALPGPTPTPAPTPPPGPGPDPAAAQVGTFTDVAGKVLSRWQMTPIA